MDYGLTYYYFDLEIVASAINVAFFFHNLGENNLYLRFPVDFKLCTSDHTCLIWIVDF